MNNPKEYSSLAFKERTSNIGCLADPILGALSKNQWDFLDSLYGVDNIQNCWM